MKFARFLRSAVLYKNYMRQILYWDKDKKKFVERIKHTENRGRTMIVSDEMPPTSHPCNGQYYTSKTKFRNETRAHGCVEVGTESLSKHVGRPESINVREIALQSWEETKK